MDNNKNLLRVPEKINNKLVFFTWFEHSHMMD